MQLVQEANDDDYLASFADVALILDEHFPAGLGSPTAQAVDANRARTIVRDAANDDIRDIDIVSVV